MIEPTPDHDLLIRIDTKLDMYARQLSEIKVDVDKRFTELWVAVDILKSDVQNAKGFIAGSKFIWALLGAIPPSLFMLLDKR